MTKFLDEEGLKVLWSKIKSSKSSLSDDSVLEHRGLMVKDGKLGIASEGHELSCEYYDEISDYDKSFTLCTTVIEDASKTSPFYYRNDVDKIGINIDASLQENTVCIGSLEGDNAYTRALGVRCAAGLGIANPLDGDPGGLFIKCGSGLTYDDNLNLRIKNDYTLSIRTDGTISVNCGGVFNRILANGNNSVKIGSYTYDAQTKDDDSKLSPFYYRESMPNSWGALNISLGSGLKETTKEFTVGSDSTKYYRKVIDANLGSGLDFTEEGKLTIRTGEFLSLDSYEGLNINLPNNIYTNPILQSLNNTIILDSIIYDATDSTDNSMLNVSPFYYSAKGGNCALNISLGSGLTEEYEKIGNRGYYKKVIKADINGAYLNYDNDGKIYVNGKGCFNWMFYGSNSRVDDGTAHYDAQTFNDSTRLSPFYVIDPDSNNKGALNISLGSGLKEEVKPFGVNNTTYFRKVIDINPYGSTIKDPDAADKTYPNALQYVKEPFDNKSGVGVFLGSGLGVESKTYTIGTDTYNYSLSKIKLGTGLKFAKDGSIILDTSVFNTEIVYKDSNADQW